MIHLNIATGINLPPFWANRPVQIIKSEETGSKDLENYLGNLYQAPLRIKWEEEGENEWWQLPFDPVISVSGKNNVVRRNVLKQSERDGGRRGSVKEAWGQDDYTVNIAGVFMDQRQADRLSENEVLLENELRKFRRYCEERRLIEVESELFTIFKIRFLAIESFDLPFTKGVENQMYAIKAYSDDLFDLLIKG